jgi:hypothetical protein
MRHVGGRVLLLAAILSATTCTGALQQSATDASPATNSLSPHPVPSADQAALILRNLAGRWFELDGSPVPDGQPFVLSVTRGKRKGIIQCHPGAVTFVLAWPFGVPLGKNQLGPDTIRVYVLQRGTGYPPENLATTPGVIEMPADARYTGFHRSEWQLWLSPSLADAAIFVTDGRTIQQAAYATRPALCL